MPGTTKRRAFFAAFGPGILFAGAAVGVSHLVQSTRAGADFGLGFLVVVLVANLVKYPAFRFGPEYAAATSTSLLEGYRRQGRFALVLYGLLTVATMFTVQAAITLVTAGLAKFLFGLELPVIAVAVVLNIVCASVLALGRYPLLDRVTKGIVALLTVSTLIATAAVLPDVPFSTIALWPKQGGGDLQTILFSAALIGWMPSAIDVSVWQSLWTLARGRDSGVPPTPKSALLDFHIGYVSTAVLAVCFVLLGAGVMHGRGLALAGRPAEFAAQVVELYVSALGPAFRPVIAVAAFATMFSTTLTVVDGFPRALAVLYARFQGPEDPLRVDAEETHRGAYWGSLLVVAAGSVAILALMLTSLTTLVDVATTLSFLTAPVLAWLNHRAMHDDAVPPTARPRPWLRWASITSILLLSTFALWYLFLALT